MLFRLFKVFGDALQQDGKKLQSFGDCKPRYALLNVKDVEMAYERDVGILFILL